ncbi:hypothetical protein T12_5477, partial [Trichinella patagoniensis]
LPLFVQSYEPRFRELFAVIEEPLQPAEEIWRCVTILIDEAFTETVPLLIMQHRMLMLYGFDLMENVIFSGVRGGVDLKISAASLQCHQLLQCCS